MTTTVSPTPTLTPGSKLGDITVVAVRTEDRTALTEHSVILGIRGNEYVTLRLKGHYFSSLEVALQDFQAR